MMLRKILIFGLTPRSESTPSRQKKTLGRNIETLIERKTFRCNWLLKKRSHLIGINFSPNDYDPANIFRILSYSVLRGFYNLTSKNIGERL